MEIITIEKYRLGVKEFDKLLDVKTHIENILGTQVINELVKVCPPAKYVLLQNMKM